MASQIIPNKFLDVALHQLGTLRLVGIRNEFFNPRHDVIRHKREVLERADEIRHACDPHVGWGIGTVTNWYHDFPDHVYHVCVEVERFEAIPRGMECIVLPPGPYAVVRCLFSDYDRAGGLIGEWRKANGYVPDTDFPPHVEMHVRDWGEDMVLYSRLKRKSDTMEDA